MLVRNKLLPDVRLRTLLGAAGEPGSFVIMSLGSQMVRGPEVLSPDQDP